MHTATIEVQYVNEPKEGKKMGSVKTKDGEYYSVWPDKLANFKPGMSYAVEYTVEDFKGKTYKTIKGLAKDNKASQQSTATNGHTKSVEMFVMGTIGRSLQGTGTFPDGATLEGWIRDARRAWVNGFNDQADDQEVPF